jgi:PAS domain S-box-containing protein
VQPILVKPEAADNDGLNLSAILQVLPAAIYTTDSAGYITSYNNAAAALWGSAPELGVSRYCGPWKLYWPDRTPLPHDQCPMALALRERRAIHGIEALGERQDGSRIPFLAYPTPLFNAAGDLVGAVNMLIDITERKTDEKAARRLAAIIESSDDAILAKDLNGIITDWNESATRLFGYTAEEAIGQSVTILIPPERHDEEPEILAKIRRGERIEHYETIRQHKDGSLIDISLTVSPILNRRGEVIGASKIARDISDQRRAEVQKNLLLREMDHRIKNLFAVSGGLVSLSGQHAASVADLVSDLRSRFAALANAHSLTLTSASDDVTHKPATTLHALARTILTPYLGKESPRLTITGCDRNIADAEVTGFALLLHEFATNAAKHGALSTSTGKIDIECSEDGKEMTMIWREHGSEGATEHNVESGFGSILIRATIEHSLKGTFSQAFADDGMELTIKVPHSH